MKKIILGIDGMTCSACSNGLEKYLNKQNGIINASVNLVMSNASIDYDETILKDVLVALGLSDNASEFSVPSTFSVNSNIMDEISIENFNKNLDVFE